MILCWGEGHGSAIHDHADAHCFMKMLKGELQEIRYAWPNDGIITEQSPIGDIGMDDEHSMEYNGQELQEISRTTMETDGVCYINGKHVYGMNMFYPFIHSFDRQIHLDFIALKILVTVTVRFRYIYTAHRSILVRFSTKKRENEPVAM